MFQILSWTAMLLTTLAAFLGTYYFDFVGPIQALVWIVWLLSILTIGFFTAEGRRVYAFGKESHIELKKVVWPTRQETIQITLIVMVMVTVTGFALWGIDSLMTWAIAKLTHLG